MPEINCTYSKKDGSFLDFGTTFTENNDSCVPRIPSTIYIMRPFAQTVTIPHKFNLKHVNLALKTAIQHTNKDQIDKQFVAIAI